MRSWIGSGLLCLAIVITPMFWPADTQWGGDDALLMKLALTANHEHHLSKAGLGGSFAYPYGPVPLDIYQGMLLVTHHLPTIVRLHVGLMTIVTSAALLWLTWSLGLSPWLAPLVMLSPFFWFYSRLLWDNTFAIPVGAMMVAAYLAFLRRESRVAFVTALVCAAILPFIHPMTLPLVAAVGAHAAWHRREAFLRHKIALMVIVICTALVNWSYCVRVARQFADSPRIPKTVGDPAEPPLSRSAAFGFPLLSGRLVSAYYFFDGRGSEAGAESSGIACAARLVSGMAFPLVWIGIVICITRFSTGWRRQGNPVDAVAVICVLTLILQSLMDGVLRISPWPHYFSGTWIVGVICFWLGLGWLARFRLASLVGIVYAVATILATTAFILGVHRAGGGKVWHGPTMGAQLTSMYLN